MSRDIGGQAFPTIITKFSGDVPIIEMEERGMTLRDYFAGQALSGFMNTFLPHDSPRTPEQKREVAELCSGLADAMIAERGKE